MLSAAEQTNRTGHPFDNRRVSEGPFPAMCFMGVVQFIMQDISEKRKGFFFCFVLKFFSLW